MFVVEISLGVMEQLYALYIFIFPSETETNCAAVLNVRFCHLMNSDGLVQDCSNSIANALELLQSCAKPLI